MSNKVRLRVEPAIYDKRACARGVPDGAFALKFDFGRTHIAATLGICAALAWFGCAEGEPVTSIATGGQAGSGGSSVGGGGATGNGGASGQDGGAGASQGGSAQGGSGPGGSAQGGSTQPGDASGPDGDSSVAGGGGRDASEDGSAGGAGTGGARPNDATADRADVSAVDARNEAALADVPAERAIEASLEAALCIAGNTCSVCAEERCPAQACALCQDTNHVSCQVGCTAILNCVIQNDGCATSVDPVCFDRCSGVINAQASGVVPRNWVDGLIRCSCF